MILILGASGTVGSEVVRQLQAKGVPFKAAYRSGAVPEGVDAVIADYARPETLDAAFAGIDRLFLLGAGGGDQTQLEINAVNAAKRAGVRHLVKLSVWGAEEEAFSFAKIHRPVERAIEQSGLAWTFIRPNGFMQNLVNYSGQSIRAEGAFYGSVGEAKISHVEIRDIAAVVVNVLTTPGHEGKIYSLSGPEALTYSEIATKVGKARGAAVKYVNLEPEQLRGGMIGAGVPAYYADLLLDLNRYYTEGHGADITSDVKQVTGRDPISFDQWARENAGALS